MILDMDEELVIKPSLRKNIRNHEIYMLVGTGATKESICERFDLSISQLNKILKDSCDEADEWFKALPRQTMIQIYRHNCEKVFHEISRLEKIRDNIAKKDSKTEFDMTRSIIATYFQYNKMVEEGPSLTRQKEVTDAAEKAAAGQR